MYTKLKNVKNKKKEWFKLEKQKWYNQEIEEVENKLQTNQERGLEPEEVEKRREKYGLNQLKASKKKTLLQRFADQFKDFSIIILIIAALVSGAVGIAEGEGITDTIIIMIVVIVNAIIRSNPRIESRKITRGFAKTNRPCLKSN